MKSFKNIFVKTTSLLLLTSICFVLGGCSGILKDIAKDKVDEYVNSVMAGVFETPVETLSLNSKTEISFPELIDEQTELFKTAVKDATISVDSIKLNDKRTEAEVSITIDKVKMLSSSNVTIGTLDEIKGAISSASKSKFNYTFKVVRSDVDDWICDDLSEIADDIYNPFAQICVTDDDGNPLSLNEAYISTIYVDFAWYDALSGNPVTNRDSMENPLALIAVFYFNQPLSLNLTADLYYEDEVVQTIDVTLDESVLAYCDFSSELSGEPFEPGEYYIVLNMNGMELARTFETEVG